MLILRFFHDENKLIVGDKEYKATCPVRNELNGERGYDKELPKTYPKNPNEPRKPYQPRKFPTGWWLVKTPIWTSDIDYAPVKIPTDASRRVMTSDGGIQKDAFYHLHYSERSMTTHGCIRFNSAEDAKEIARTIIEFKNREEEIWLEVIASKNCVRR